MVAEDPIEWATIAAGTRPDPWAATTARSVRAYSGIDVMPRAEAPFPGASNVTTANPAATSGSTNAASRAPRLLQPCTR